MSEKNATFLIQVTENLRRNGSKNGIKVNYMLEYLLQHEGYWMKTLRTVYPYDLNEIIKCLNKDSPMVKLFLALPRYGEHFTDTISQSKRRNHDLSFDIDIFFNFFKKFLLRDGTDKCRKIYLDVKFKIHNILKRWIDCFSMEF